MEEQGYGKYLTVFSVVSVAALSLLAVINASIDPLGVYRHDSDDFLEPYRVKTYSRIKHAEDLRHAEFDTLVLGSSRAKRIPEELPAWGDRKVINAALGGTNLREVLPALEYAIEHKTPDEVFLFLDFMQFAKGSAPLYDFSDSRYGPDFNPVLYHIKCLTGIHATEESYGTLMRFRRKEIDTIFPEKPPPPRARFEIAQRKLLEKRMLNPGVYSREELRNLADTLSKCLESDVRITLAISPVHAVYLEMFDIAGIWPEYVQWKRDLVEALAEINAGLPEEKQIKLWDFTSYRGYNAEPVPSDDEGVEMRWYTDLGHGSWIMADYIVYRMMGRQPEGEEIDESFGILLTRDNIEPHLALLESDREVFRTEQAEVCEYFNSRVREFQGVAAQESRKDRRIVSAGSEPAASISE